jgi:hypothetical protein
MILKGAIAYFISTINLMTIRQDIGNNIFRFYLEIFADFPLTQSLLNID